MQPLYTMKPGFKHLVSKLDPKYIPPSRKYFAMQEIPRLYTEVKDNIVKPSIIEAKYFAATSDLWTSCTNHPYFSYIIHFIDKEFALKSFCLNTVPFFKTTLTRTLQRVSRII